MEASRLAENPAAVESEVLGMVRDVEDVTGRLRDWHDSRESDSVQVQRRRDADYDRACELLTDLVCRASERGCVMQLTAGSEPVETKRISKGVYGFMDISSGDDLAPGDSIVLKHQSDLINYRARARNVYLGESGRDMEIADIARALATGGSIELVEAERRKA